MKRALTLIQVIAFAVLMTVPGPAGAADVFKFGVSTPLSGPAAPWGISDKNATELIFDKINAQGGLDVGGKKYKLEVVAYDHKYVIAEGVATVNRLIAKDKVKYISVLGGSVVKAPEETVNEGRVLNLPLAAGDDRVLEVDQGEASPDQAGSDAVSERRHRLVVDQGGDGLRAEARLRGGVEGVL